MQNSFMVGLCASGLRFKSRPAHLFGTLILSISALVCLPASAEDHYVECKSLDRNWTDEDCWHDRHRPDHKGGSDIVIGKHYGSYEDQQGFKITINNDVVDHYYGVTNMPIETVTLGLYGTVRDDGWRVQSYGVLQVSGKGAGLTASHHIYLGKEGGKGLLIINDGAVVRADRVFAGGYYGSSAETDARGFGTGQIQLTGDGSELIANKIVLGVHDIGWQNLQIHGGALVTADDLIINSTGNNGHAHETVLDIQDGGMLKIDHLSYTQSPPELSDFNLTSIGSGGTVIARLIDAPHAGDAPTGTNSSFTLTGGTLYMIDRGWHETPSTTFNGQLFMDDGSTLSFDATMLDGNPDLYISGGIKPNGQDYYRFNSFTIKILAAADGSVPDLDTAFPLIRQGEVHTDLSHYVAATDYQFLKGSLSEDGDLILFRLSRNETALTDMAVTGNEFAVGGALDGEANDHGVLNALLGLTTDQSARDAFNGLSGEIHASTLTSMIDQGLRSGDVVSNRLHRVLTSGDASASGLNFWLANQGGQARFDAVSSAEKSRIDYLSVTAGIDAVTDVGLQLGAALEYSKSYIRVDARSSRADIESIGALLYAGRNVGDYQLTGGAGVASHHIDSRRFTGLMPLSGPLDGDYSGLSGNIWLDASRYVVSGENTLTPFVRLDQTILHTSDFTEENGIAALRSSDHTQTNTFTTLGVRGERSVYETPELTTKLTGQIGWRHAFGDLTPEQTMQYAIGSNAFSIEGRALDRDVMTVELGLAARAVNGFTLDISYSGAYGDDSTDHGIMATARFVF